MAEYKPRAFLSYVRHVDLHDNRAITTLRERLEGELQVQSGEPFPIFQDWKDIGWGQDWERKIEGSLDDVLFLVPLLTEGFFRSQPCRRELELFAERERKLGRIDLILPLVYTACPTLTSEEDPLVAILKRHNWESWIELRHEPATSPNYGRAIARLANRVIEATARARPVPAQVAVPSRGRSVDAMPTVGSASSGPTAAMEPASSRTGFQALIKEPPIRVVDALHRGDHASLAEAVANAAPGDRLLVQPGFYHGPVVIDKPLEILGQGGAGEVVVEGRGGNAFIFNATRGRVADITVRQSGGGNYYAIKIAQGRLLLERCQVVSASLSCLAVHSGADPVIRGCSVHDGKASGIHVYEQGRGTVEDNDIFASASAGISVKEGGDPVVRGNRVNRNGYEGVWVYEGGGGTYENNDLTGNQRGAWDVADDCLARVSRKNNKES